MVPHRGLSCDCGQMVTGPPLSEVSDGLESNMAQFCGWQLICPPAGSLVGLFTQLEQLRLTSLSGLDFSPQGG